MVTTKTPARGLPLHPNFTHPSVARASDPALAAARESVPGLAEELSKVDRLRSEAMRYDLIGVGDLRDRILEEIADSGEVPTDLADRIIAAGASRDAFDNAQYVLVGAMRRIAGNVDRLIREGVDDMRANLNSQLEQLLDQTSTDVINIAGSDAEDAIADGATEVWQQWRQCLNSYAQLRQAQSLVDRVDEIWSSSVLPYGLQADDVRYMPQIDTHLPDWAKDRLQFNLDVGEMRGRPWTSPSHHEEVLAWALQGKHRLWVPTTTQATEEAARLAETLRSIGNPLAPSTSRFSGTPEERRRVNRRMQ